MRKSLPSGTVSLCFLLMFLTFPGIDLQADPQPLPADPNILSLVNQLSADSLLENVTTLVNFHTRHTYSDTVSSNRGIGAARTWTRAKFDLWGTSTEFFPWTSYFGGHLFNCYNVHATVNGNAGDIPGIILGGHLDSRGASGSDTSVFAPGADDDGSSVAAMLEMNRVLAGTNLDNIITLSAFAGEEQGLLGAHAYAQSLQNSGADLTAMLNMDMIGHIVHPSGLTDSTTLRCFSGPPQGSSSRQLARYVKWVGEAYSDGLTVTLINALDRPGRSGDHVAFYNRGFPSVRIMETAEDVAFQHGPNDIPENMSFSYARKICRLVLGVTTVLALTESQPPAPEVINGGDGETLIVSWSDSLTPPPGGVIRIAYRITDELNWEDILTTSDPPPYVISGLTEYQEYGISISVSNQDGLPSPFSGETNGTPIGAVPPDNFETTSTPNNVHLQWTPRPEQNTQDYLIERTIPGGQFAQITTITHPDSEWFDTDLEIGQLYLYRVRTRTTEQIVGEPTPIQEGRLASHHLGILVIDATPDGAGAPSFPGDEEVDQFYDSLLAAFEVSDNWDRRDSINANVTISDADLAPYSHVFVHIDAMNTTIAEDTTAFRKFLANWGRIMISGWRLSNVLAGRTGYNHGFHPGDFMYDIYGIDSIRVTPLPEMEFVGTSGSSGYPNLDFDSARFPVWQGGLLLIDAIWTETFPGDVDVIATFLANSGASYPHHGRNIGLRGGSANPSWILMDVPVFYMTTASAYNFLNHALSDLDAPMVYVDDPGVEVTPLRFQLANPYPNPFNAITIFSYILPLSGNASLTVYDIQGRRVAALSSGWHQGGAYRVSFDAADLSSGIYFAVLSAGGLQQTQKILLLK